MSKLNFNLVVLSIFLILISIDAKAIGVTPGRTTLDFEPGLKRTIEYTVLNNEHKEMKVIVYTEGELNSSVILHDSIIEFKEEESSKTLKYDVILPNELKEPGLHEAKIVVRELQINSVNKGNSVGATIAVVTQLYVNVPFPGKYAKAEMKVSQQIKDNAVAFIITVSNLGTQDIVKATGLIDIFGANNEKVTALKTNEIFIKSKERSELYSNWDTKKVNSGKYYAKTTITYDEKTTDVELVFNVGDLLLDIISVDVKDFKLGGIAKFNFLVENKWNEQLKNVYAEMTIEDQSGNKITDIKSASEDIKPNSKSQLIAYWDTAGVKEGSYNADLVVYYADKSVHKQLRTIVTLNSIKAEFIGINAEAIAVRSGLNNQGILMFVVFILIAVNIGWFVYFKKRKK